MGNRGTAQAIFSSSSLSYGFFSIEISFGGRSAEAGLSSRHFLATQNLKNDRSRSSFFRAVEGLNFHPSRNFPISSGPKRLTSQAGNCLLNSSVSSANFF